MSEDDPEAIAKKVIAALYAQPKPEVGDLIVFACKPTQLRTIAPGSRKPKPPRMTAEEARASFSHGPRPKNASRARARKPMLDGVTHLGWARTMDFAVALVAGALLREVADLIERELTFPPVMVGPYGDLLEVPTRWIDAMAAASDAEVEKAAVRASREAEHIRELVVLARSARAQRKRLYVWSSASFAAREDD